MLWTPTTTYQPEPFEKENDLEKAIIEVQKDLFGESRIYIDVKKKIGIYGTKQNIPDGYPAGGEDRDEARGIVK